MDDTDPLSFYLLSITTTDFGIGFWISVVVLVLLLVSSAFISGSEAAFFSLSPEEREGVDVGNEPYTETASQLLRQPKDLLAIIVILSCFIFDQIYPANPDLIGVDYLRATIEIAGITFVLLLIGEVIPKVYATRNSLSLVKLMSSPLNFISKLPPFSWLKNFLVNGTEVILKYARKRQIDVSTDDLENAIALTREESTSPDEQRILEGIVNFGNTDVRQI